MLPHVPNRIAKGLNGLMGRRGPVAMGLYDAYSSALAFAGWDVALPPVVGEIPVVPARTWLLTVGWRKQGPLAFE
jgi:hypothetical protein